MKKILLISAFLAATFGAYAQVRDTVETRDTTRVYRDGAVRMRAHHSVTITAKTDHEELFGPVIPVPARMDSNLAVQAVTKGSVRLNERYKHHSNIAWMFFERKVVLFDELSYDATLGVFRFRERQEPVSSGGPLFLWCVVGAVIISAFFLGFVLWDEGRANVVFACAILFFMAWFLSMVGVYLVNAPHNLFSFGEVKRGGCLLLFVTALASTVFGYSGFRRRGYLVHKKKQKRQQIEAAAAAAS